MRTALETVVGDVCFLEALSEDMRQQCAAIARSLPEYFNAQGFEQMKHDLRHSRCCVALDGGAVIGFASVAMKYPGVAEILWFAVCPDRQRQGVGSTMLAAICGELRSLGICLLQVKTLAPTVEYEPYERTRQFYERNGFLLVEIIDPFPGWEPGNPCALYIKALS